MLESEGGGAKDEFNTHQKMFSKKLYFFVKTLGALPLRRRPFFRIYLSITRNRIIYSEKQILQSMISNGQDKHVANQRTSHFQYSKGHRHRTLSGISCLLVFPTAFNFIYSLYKGISPATCGLKDRSISFLTANLRLFQG